MCGPNGPPAAASSNSPPCGPTTIRPAGSCTSYTDLAIAGEETARFGGDGTPEVAEFAPAELGVEIGLSPGQARMLIADALDLRHRLPRLWGRVQAGQVPARDARRVAARTRLLTVEQAMVVDRRVARVVGQLSWTRLDHLLAAEILRVDRVRVEQETENAKRFRYIRTGQGSEYGLTEVSMLVDTPDAILLKAATKRLADILMGRADDLPAGIPDRGARSKAEWQAVAAGILAQPALALQVLAQVDQPDLFTDLEAHLQVADHQPRPDLPMPDRPMRIQPVPGGQMPDQPIPGGQMPDQQMPDQPMPDRQIPAGPRPDQPMPDLPDPGPGSEPSDSDLADFDPGPPTDLPASDLPGPDLPMPDEPGSDDPRPGLDPQPQGEPSRAERREAVMKDLARRIDPDKLTPRVVLHVHIGADALPTFNRGDDPGVARVEGIGPVLLASVREWLGSGCRVRILPVLDPARIPPADSYEIPDRMVEAVLARSPASVFPWSGTTSRHRLDLDHTVPYTRPPGAPPGASPGGPPNGPPDGPPGQTRLDNLGPLTRGEHRYKTFGPINVTQPVAGTFVWRTRFGRVIVTNPAGTHDLGTGTFADTVWQTSADRAPSPAA